MAGIEGNSTSRIDSRLEEPLLGLADKLPLNFKGLGDVIAYSTRRPRFHLQTNSPSDGGDVRWYYRRIPLADNELAASVPCSEIAGKKEYIRFGMKDSLSVEAFFLQKEEELLSCWWKEFAESREGPSIRANPSRKSHDAPPFKYQNDADRVGVPVKGGLYEIDLAKRHCFPVYWVGENWRVLRGHWFAFKGGQWLPLREDVSEQLEIAYCNKVWHHRTFQESGLFAARIDLHGCTKGLHALFTGEDDTWEAWLNVYTSGFSSVFGSRGNCIKLRRGYSASPSHKPTQDELHQQKEEEMDDYNSQVPVRHIVFMVHGIGQRLEKSNLVDDVEDFRRVTEILAQGHLTLNQRCAQRILFIPCQWRKGLKLSSEAAVKQITLDGLRGLRIMLSATVHDVLYYMSPIHCQDIIDSVSNQLNRLYLKFLRRNPLYDGKVSIFGHSLGSVLSYDILCHQEMSGSKFPMKLCFKECQSKESQFDGETVFHQISPAASEFSKANEMEDNASQTAIQKGANEFLQESCAMFPEETDDTVETSSQNSRLPINPIGQISREECKDCAHEDEETNFTEDEMIYSLQTKRKELESHCITGHLQECSKVIGVESKQPSTEYLSPCTDGRPTSYTPSIKYTKLAFKVDTFFAVGSPLGLFLALRNVRIGIGKGQTYWDEGNIEEEMPACHRMLNIFHPFDPVAYRIEPLVCKDYVSKRPVTIPYHKGGSRLHIRFQEFAEDVAARSRAAKDHLNTVRDRVLTACQPRDSEEAETYEQTEQKSYGAIMMEKLAGPEGRIDRMLQDKTLEYQYLQAMGSHTNYWRDNDTSLFILRHLYKDISEQTTR